MTRDEMRAFLAPLPDDAILGLTLYGAAHLSGRRRAFLTHWALAMGVLAGLLLLALSFINSRSEWPALIMAYGLGGGWVLLGLALGWAKPAALPPA